MSNELSRQPQGPSKAYCESVVSVVEMLFDTLDTYGKKATANLTDGWILVLYDRGVLQSELMKGARYFLNGKDFPKPGEFCDWVFANRENEETAALLREAEILSAIEGERNVLEWERRHGLEGASRDEIIAKAKLAIEGGGVPALGRMDRIKALPLTLTTREMTTEEMAQAERVREQARKLRLN